MVRTTVIHTDALFQLGAHAQEGKSILFKFSIFCESCLWIANLSSRFPTTGGFPQWLSPGFDPSREDLKEEFSSSIQYCLENSMGGRAWQATACGVTESDTTKRTPCVRATHVEKNRESLSIYCAALCLVAQSD